MIFFSLFLHGGQRYPYHGIAAYLLIFHFRPQSIQVSYRFLCAGQESGRATFCYCQLSRVFSCRCRIHRRFVDFTVTAFPVVQVRPAAWACSVHFAQCVTSFLFCRSFFHRSKSACTAGSSNIRLMQPISVLHMASDWWAGMASASICTVFGVLVSTLFNAAPPFWWFFFPLLPLPDILISSILAG